MRQIPGVHPVNAVSEARDEMGGLVLMLLQTNSEGFQNLFDRVRRELAMQIAPEAVDVNDKIQSVEPIRLFFKTDQSLCYRFLGGVTFSSSAADYYILRIEQAANLKGLP